MGGAEVGMRALAAQSDVPLSRLRGEGPMSDIQVDRLNDAAARLSSAPIWFDDVQHLDIHQIAKNGTIGFNSYMDKGTGAMKHELAGYANSPRYQHQAQLAVTTELFTRTFGLAPSTAYVLCANDMGVSYHELEPAFRRLAPAVIARLSAVHRKG
jgi:hypothetical protein